MTLLILFLLANYIAFHVALFRLFKQAGKNPWLSIIPVADIVTWLAIIHKPKWWFLMLLLPGAGFVFLYIMLLSIVRCYKRPTAADKAGVLLLTGFYLCYITFKQEFKGIPEPERETSGATVVVGTVFFIVASIVFFRMFLLEAYMIPTPSMEKTLLVGDFIFVAKSAYGARIPNTPLAFPFVHHTMPVTGMKSYLEWLKLPYTRLGKCNVQRNDLVVFNCPAGDTVVLENQAPSYYDIVRYTAYSNGITYDEARSLLWNDPNTHIITRPVDKRENYIKRCVAIAGDVLEIKNGVLYINGQEAKQPEELNTPWNVILKEGAVLTPEVAQQMGMEDVSSRYGVMQPNHLVVLMTKRKAEELRKLNVTNLLQPFYYPKGEVIDPVPTLYPNNLTYFKWNVDNYGPLMLPKKGLTITLTDSVYALYDRAIRVYENNKVERRDGKFFINGKEATSYTFKMDYYWMMGDNRHNSQDSRYWGFVPEDHIGGKAWCIWMSYNSRTGAVSPGRIGSLEGK